MTDPNPTDPTPSGQAPGGPSPADASFDLPGYVTELAEQLRRQVADGDAAAATKLRHLEARLDELDDAVATSTAPADPVPDLSGGADDADEEVELAFPDLEAWVAGHFAPIYVRPIGGHIRWCASWWDHPEAIVRLEALWRSWETLRLNPTTGMAAWLVSYLDPLLAVLLAPTGPFARCGPDRHDPAGKPMPTVPAPPGWWEP